MKKILCAALFLVSASAFAQTEVTSVNSDTNLGSLRKRTHAMTWDYSSGTSKVKNKDTNVETETTSGEMKFGYLYNLGRFELGVNLSSSTSETDGANDESTTGMFGLIGEFNFIENTPGNDLIPYAKLELVGVSIKTEGSSDIGGSGYGLGVGIKWFPLSQIFALKAELSYIKGSLEVDDTSVEVDLSGVGIGVGWALYF